jgi:hypothetical protein
MIIPVDTSIEGVKLIHKLGRIAMKVHQGNVSPVDIKLELAELNPDHLQELLAGAEEVMTVRGVQFVPVEKS